MNDEEDADEEEEDDEDESSGVGTRREWLSGTLRTLDWFESRIDEVSEELDVKLESA